MVLDCLIIGGGPAGLTAARYLARYRRSALVIDAGASRALAIPESHNHPGFAGISGKDLLERMSSQAKRWGVEVRGGTISGLKKEGDVFVAQSDEQDTITSRCVLLATGLIDVAPPVADLEISVAKGVVRFCPICDAYEAIDKKIAVLGPEADAIAKALFLRSYTRWVTVLPTTDTDKNPAGRTNDAEIQIAAAPPIELRTTSSGIHVKLENGEELEFDVLYPVLGCSVRSGLARVLGAHCTPLDFIKVSDKQLTSVEGLYAAGDVVSDLHQLSVAEGHAAIAATAIHNCLPRNFR
jgi:thioredoxin reductase (NADPH)